MKALRRSCSRAMRAPPLGVGGNGFVPQYSQIGSVEPERAGSDLVSDIAYWLIVRERVGTQQRERIGERDPGLHGYPSRRLVDLDAASMSLFELPRDVSRRGIGLPPQQGAAREV